MLLSAAARAEEVVRGAEAQRKRGRELEAREAEREAAEIAELFHSDPEVCTGKGITKRHIIPYP